MRVPAAFLLALALAACTTPQAPAGRWVAIWAASQQIPEERNALEPDDYTDATLRQYVRVTRGAKLLRLRVSNAFGTEPLHITAATIALGAPGSPRVQAQTITPLRFSGDRDVLIPAGADYLSDPVAFDAPAFSDIAVSLHFEHAPAQQTGHPGSRLTSFIGHGDLTAAADFAPAKEIAHWYHIAAIEAVSDAGAEAVAVIGDSITDGRGSTTDGNDRWPDQLSHRLQAAPATRRLSVLNLGVGGNRLLQDGLGPNAVARFDRDVIAQAGVRYVIVLEGVNDLGTLSHDATPEQHAELVARMIGAYEQMIARAHAHGVRIYGATILPYMGAANYAPTPANEADRQAVNAWIRAPGHFDAVIDFDAVMRDPTRPDALLPAYETGDHLHPNVAGYGAMAGAVPLSLFQTPPPFQIAPLRADRAP
ncbi:MAG TPA: SGNH/GDSL hydrolase family protein [Caulobacterales bacterium]|nr:SGNH/GDSL hydrolase family protein [Caulobacterales bacterium]